MEEKAARAYDLAALKYWGVNTHINFQVSPRRFVQTNMFLYDDQSSMVWSSWKITKTSLKK